MKIDIQKKEQLAGIFKEAREKKKMTQRELANRANVTERTICNLESGNHKSTFKIETLKPIAKALGYKIETFIKRKG
jgi:transcriptional regulator with XRE-family HTH domain